MKSNEFDQLLSGLLGNKNGGAAPQDYEEPRKSSAASEESRRRVEEIMKNVEMESDKRKSEEQSRQKVQPPLKREPVVVPPPISHFSDEPSQNPAVRMRDRLDETALPMLDSERKPTQIIPPKPKSEPAPRKKKKKQVQQLSSDIPAPPTPPKRTVPHIVVPDELPPDIPREIPVSDADEERRKKLEAIRRAVREQRSSRLETVQDAAVPMEDTAEPTRIMKVAADEPSVPFSVSEEQPVRNTELIAETAEPIVETADPTEDIADEITEPDENDREQEILSKAQKIKQQIRLAMEEVQSIPEAEELIAESEEPQSDSTQQEEDLPEEAAESIQEEKAPEIPETISEPEAPAAPRLRHLSVPAEPEKKQGLFSRFRKKQQEESVYEAAEDEETAETLQETEELQPLAEPEVLDEPEVLEEPEEYAEPELYEEPEVIAEPEPPIEPDMPEELEHITKPEVTEETQDAVQTDEVSIDVSLPEEEEKARKRSAFAAAIRAALDENAQELEDAKAEQLPDDSEIDVAVGKSRKGKRGYFVIGIICTIFAIVGIAFCVMQAIRWIRDFADSSSLKTQLEDVLYPAAVMDLPEFNDPAEAAPEMLMSAAVIDILMYGDLSQYTEVFDVISIPAEDVRNRAEAMFGVTLSDEFVTLFAAGELFFYDEGTGCYNVPSSPVIFSYAPIVQEIKRAEDVYTLTVVYRADTAQWQQRSDNFTSIGEKTMEITLHKNEDNYQIVRIVNVSQHSSGI